MAGRVEGKVALITGGGSGIGRATALLFGREGAKVLVADYDPEGGERTVKTIKEAGGTAVFHAADVSNPQDVDGLMHKVVETYGRLDCAFNNAGIEGHMAVTPECTTRELESGDRDQPDRRVPVHEVRNPADARRMAAAVIVNTASAAGLVGGVRGAGLFRRQARRGRADEDRRTRIRAEGDSGECGLSRSYSDADGRANPG